MELPTPTDYVYLDSIEKIKLEYGKLIDLCSSGDLQCISMDLETTGLSPYLEPDAVILLWSISYAEGKSFTVPYKHPQSPFVDDPLALKAICSLTSELLDAVPLTNHNLKFDLHWMIERLGVIPKHIYGDTYLASWTLFNDTIHVHDLDSLATEYVGMYHHKGEMKQALAELNGVVADADGYAREPNMGDLNIDLVHRYCCADADATLRLQNVFDKMLISAKLYDAHTRVCVPAILPVTMLEHTGIRVDTSLLDYSKVEYEDKLNSVYTKLDEMKYSDQIISLVNMMRSSNAESSGKKPPKPVTVLQRDKCKGAIQLTPATKSVLVFDILGFKPISYGKTGPCCDKDTLGLLMERCTKHIGTADDENGLWSHKLEVVEMVRNFSADNKMYSSYIKPIPKYVDPKGLMHPGFGIRTTDTGRFNCRGPSLHIFPWKSLAKRAVVPNHPDGMIVSADYSQMELRILASVANDKSMIEAFNTGQDLHRLIASRVLNKPADEVLTAERRRLKTVVFGVCYGRGAASVAAQERISEDEAQSLIYAFFEMFPDVARWIKAQHRYASKHKCIWSPIGFRRLFESYLNDGQRDRRAVNTPIQGGASDVGVTGLTNTYYLLEKARMKSTLFGFVHDSLLFSVYPGELWDVCLLARKGMQDRPQRELKWLKAPLRIDFEIGSSWGELSEAEMLPDRRIKFVNCNPKYHDSYKSKFSFWSDPPELVSEEKKNVLEDGSAIYQTMSATASREAEYVTTVESVWEFPKRSVS